MFLSVVRRALSCLGMHACARPAPLVDQQLTYTYICTNNKPQVLAANIEAQDLGGPDGPPVYLHLCNNNPDPKQHAYIEAVLRNVTGLAGYRLQTFPDNPVRGYECVDGARACVMVVASPSIRFIISIHLFSVRGSCLRGGGGGLAIHPSIYPPCSTQSLIPSTPHRPNQHNRAASRASA